MVYGALSAASSKQHSMKAQGLWSDTMSQVEETLGGLRIIKAFCAEEKMNQRVSTASTAAYRDDIMRVNIRQQLAHPMSEFLRYGDDHHRALGRRHPRAQQA
jgi:ABC-type multidrug transport system fused ATPase/permease subunit